MLTSHTLFDTVGNTPLLRLAAIGKELEGVELYAKAEYFNPTGSVKDRAAKAMIMDGIARGALTHDKTIIDATSGNTGIAYAALGAALGYKVALCLPANATEERKKLMKLYGAEIIETDPLESSDGAYNECRRLVAEHSEKYFYPDQYNNDANWKAHFDGTAVEIWEQTEVKVDIFVAGVGTGGTITGVGEFLKSKNPDIKIVAVEPADSPVLSGGAAGADAGRLSYAGRAGRAGGLRIQPGHWTAEGVDAAEGDQSGRLARQHRA